MARPKWYHCVDTLREAKSILAHGFVNLEEVPSPGVTIWVTKDAPDTSYGRYCFEVKLPRSARMTYKDESGWPLRYAFHVDTDVIPPERFTPVELE